MTENRDR